MRRARHRWTPGRGTALVFSGAFGIAAVVLAATAAYGAAMGFTLVSVHCFNVAYDRPTLAEAVAVTVRAWRRGR